MTPIEELLQKAQIRLDDEVAFWRDKWTHHVVKPSRRLWAKRPWWLKKKTWEWVWRIFHPEFDRAWKAIWKFHQQAKLMKVARLIEETFPSLVRDLRMSTYGSFIDINVNIEDTINEAEPVVGFLTSNGWKIEERTDEYYGRKLKMVHPDWLVKLYVKCRAQIGGGCEVVRHVEKKTIEEVEYEVICEGERELTGRTV